MKRGHLVVPAARWRETPQIAARFGGLLAVSFAGASTPMLFAALAPQPPRTLVPWLVLGESYSASLAARDVGTLCQLMDVSDVVISSMDAVVDDHATIMWRLLTQDDVSVANRAASITHAYNRPLPEIAPTLWVSDDAPDSPRALWRRVYSMTSSEEESSVVDSELVGGTL